MKTIIKVAQGIQYNPENGFEVVHQHSYRDFTDTLTRLKVIGGWLLTKTCSKHSPAMCFVPDPEHKWELEYKKGKK